MASNEQITANLSAWVAEGLQLRFGDSDAPVTLPDYALGPVALRDSLYGIRPRMDRLEAIKVNAIRIKARLDRQYIEQQAEAELALYRATQKNAGKRGEYTSALQTRSDAELDSFEERRAAKQAELRRHEAEEAVTILTELHRELDKLRLEHLSMLKSYENALRFSSSQEQ